MKKPKFFTVLIFMSLGLVGCSVFFPNRAQREARQTAVAATRTQQAANAQATLDARGPTNTPKPGILEISTRTPSPTRTATPTSTSTPTLTPFVVLDTKIVSPYGRQYAPIFEDPGDIVFYKPGNPSTVNGNLGPGMQVQVSEYYHGGDAAQVVISGWVEAKDLGIEVIPEDPKGIKGELTCETHFGSGHVDGKSLCHAHAWSEMGEIGTLPKGMTYEVIKTKVKGRLLFVQLWPPMWIRCQDLQGGCPAP